MNNNEFYNSSADDHDILVQINQLFSQSENETDPSKRAQLILQMKQYLEQEKLKITQIEQYLEQEKLKIMQLKKKLTIKSELQELVDKIRDKLLTDESIYFDVLNLLDCVADNKVADWNDPNCITLIEFIKELLTDWGNNNITTYYWHKIFGSQPFPGKMEISHA